MFAKAVFDKNPVADDTVFIPRAKGLGPNARVLQGVDPMRFFIMKGTKNREAAEQLIHSLLAPDVQREIWKTGTGYAYPAYEWGWDEKILNEGYAAKVTPAWKAVSLDPSAYIGASYPGPPSPWVSSLASSNFWTDMFGEVLGGKSPEDALKSGHERPCVSRRSSASRASKGEPPPPTAARREYRLRRHPPPCAGEGSRPLRMAPRSPRARGFVMQLWPIRHAASRPLAVSYRPANCPNAPQTHLCEVNHGRMGAVTRSSPTICGSSGHAAPPRGDIVSGRPFLQIPGPTNVPDRILRAMDRPVIDHRGPEFGAMVRGLLPDVAKVFKSEQGKVVLYPSSGTGAWEAAIVNTMAPGDRVLSFNNGHFSTLFAEAARSLGIEVDEVPLRWGQGVPADLVEEKLRADLGNSTAAATYKAVLVVHNETSTGVTSNVVAVRQALDATGHDALLIVDTVSSLASIDFRMDEWGVDVTLTGSQKGLMLPPGMALLCVGPRGVAAGENGGSRAQLL